MKPIDSVIADRSHGESGGSREAHDVDAPPPPGAGFFAEVFVVEVVAAAGFDLLAFVDEDDDIATELDTVREPVDVVAEAAADEAEVFLFFGFGAGMFASCSINS